MARTILSDWPMAAATILLAQVPQDLSASFAGASSLWFIRIAALLMALVLAMQLRGWGETEPLIVGFWTIGALLAILHAATAIWAFHSGSHWNAFESTAQQTESVLGFRFGTGLYFNYLFNAVWVVDALWRIATPTDYRSRPKWVRISTYFFLILIAFNGTVVFAKGPVQIIGIVCSSALLIQWLLVLRQRKQHRLAISNQV